MSATNLWKSLESAPDDVSHDLDRKFAYCGAKGLSQSSFYEIVTLNADALRNFYNLDDPQYGAASALTRAEDVRKVLNISSMFLSRNCAGLSALLGHDCGPTHRWFCVQLNNIFVCSRPLQQRRWAPNLLGYRLKKANGSHVLAHSPVLTPWSSKIRSTQTLINQHPTPWLRPWPSWLRCSLARRSSAP